MDIQWYPGHMTKARRMMQEQLSLVDMVIEVVDARIPRSSRNPDIGAMASHKKRLVVLNKSDLADEQATRDWVRFFAAQGAAALPFTATRSGASKRLKEAVMRAMQEDIARAAEKGRTKTVRALVAGIPNVGKSALINNVAGASVAKTGNAPGVTRGKQWIRAWPQFELLDTPGLLWPKFDDPTVGLHLAFIGSVRDQILDAHTLACALLSALRICAPGAVAARYGVDTDVAGAGEAALLERIGAKRGCLLAGGMVDADRAARIIIDEFRGGKLGRITLERPDEA